MPRKKRDKEKENKLAEDSKLFAFLATFLSIVGFIIALLAKKDDKYVMFYAKQSLLVFIACIIGGAISAIVGWIPIIGWLIAGAINIVVLILWIMSWVYALSGEMKEVPWIGKYSRKINL